MQDRPKDVLLEAVDATPCMPEVLANLSSEDAPSSKNPFVVRHGDTLASALPRTRSTNRRTASGATATTTVNQLTSFADYFVGGDFSQPPWQCSTPALLAAFVAATHVLIAVVFTQLGFSANDDLVNWEIRARNAHVTEALAIQFLGLVIDVERSLDFLSTVIVVSSMVCNVTERSGARVLPWMQLEPNCSDLTWAYPPFAPWATNLSYLSERRASLQELTWGVLAAPSALQDAYLAAAANSTAVDAAQRFLLMSVHDAEWVLPYGSTMYSLLSCVRADSTDDGRSAALEVIFPSGNYLSLWCGATDGTPNDEFIGMSSFALLPTLGVASAGNSTSAGNESAPVRPGLFREVTCSLGAFYGAVAWLAQFLSCTTIDCCAVVESQRPSSVNVTFRLWSAEEFDVAGGALFATLADAVVGATTGSSSSVGNGFVALSNPSPGDGLTRQRALWHRETLSAPAAVTQWWACKGVALSLAPTSAVSATTIAVCAMIVPWECGTALFTHHDPILRADNFVVAVEALDGGRVVSAAGVVNGTLATVPLVNSSWCLKKSMAAVKLDDAVHSSASHHLPGHLAALVDTKPLDPPPLSWCAGCSKILPLQPESVPLASTPLAHAESIAALVDHLSTPEASAALQVSQWPSSGGQSRLNKTNGIAMTDVVVAPPVAGIDAFSVIWVDPVAVLFVVGSLTPEARESHRLTMTFTLGGIALVVTLLTYALAFWVTYPLQTLKSAVRESDAKVVHAVARASWEDRGVEVQPPMEDVGAAAALALEVDTGGTSNNGPRLRHAGVTLPNTTEWNSILSISCIEVCNFTSLYAWVRHLSQLSLGALQATAANVDGAAARKDRGERLRDDAAVAPTTAASTTAPTPSTTADAAVTLTLATACLVEHVALVRLRFPMPRSNPNTMVGVSVLHSAASHADSWSDAAVSDIHGARKPSSLEYLALVAETVYRHGGELWPVHRQDEVLIVFSDAPTDEAAEAARACSKSGLSASLTLEQRAVNFARELLRLLNDLYYGSSREWVESQAAVLTPSNSPASRPIVSGVVDAGLVQFTLVNGSQPLLHGDVVHRMDAMLRSQQANPPCTLLCSDRVQARLESEDRELLFSLMPIVPFSSVQLGDGTPPSVAKFGCAFLVDTVAVAIGELTAVSQYNEPRQHDRLCARIDRLREPHTVSLARNGSQVVTLSLIQLAAIIAALELGDESIVEGIREGSIPSWVPIDLCRREALALLEDALDDLNDAPLQSHEKRFRGTSATPRPYLGAAMARYLPKFAQVYFDEWISSASAELCPMGRSETKNDAIDATPALLEDGASAVVQAPW